MEATELTIESASEAQRQKAGRLLVEREIRACVSSFMDELFRANALDSDLGYSYDDVENLYENRCPECGEAVREIEDDEDSPHDYACECCSWTGDDAESTPQEIYEWWLVESFLARDLKARGHPILESAHGPIWGRCCTGQAILLDRAIQEIAFSLDWIRREVAEA